MGGSRFHHQGTIGKKFVVAKTDQTKLHLRAGQSGGGLEVPIETVTCMETTDGCFERGPQLWKKAFGHDEPDLVKSTHTKGYETLKILPSHSY